MARRNPRPERPLTVAELKRLRKAPGQPPADSDVVELLRYLEVAASGTEWPVRRLHYLRRARTRLDHLEHEIVVIARANGVTWEAIGAVDDVTRSAALQRQASLSARLDLPRS